MDVIAGRKNLGKTTGEILVNGVAKDDRTFGRVVGYVEQTDIHDPFATVREGLTFAAKLVRYPLICLLRSLRDCQYY